ncbi:hypothetical protein Vadar_006967 [Vaccinium darrowii]|uniref:Uncharacterized protein n=1 Tax=Vaccinium darrowii TaxID=229202 RepID=A0ACB7XNR8_9ERIC|nr:hypothetical protein Vadar_006967 [Vaccinium darrowii]
MEVGERGIQGGCKEMRWRGRMEDGELVEMRKRTRLDNRVCTFDQNHMDMNVVLLLLVVVSSLLLGHNSRVEGGKRLSGKEDLELEKELKLLNKPAVKTLYTEYGDIIDCVDFYKQPAFDHPLLKNHTFHYKMKRSPLHRKARDQNSSKLTKPVSIGLKGGGCPIGTVPIRRITKEDLIRERFSSRIMGSADNIPGAHYAIARTGTSSNKYLGAGAGISIHNPPASGRQYSAARVKIQNGPDSIEVGWRVDPSLYGDIRTRLFVRLDAGGSHCFNTRCPGFVLVRSDMPVDMVFSRISQPGTSDIFVVRAYYVRDQVNGNWWLELGSDNTEIGFWPKALFTGLGDLANYVEWGGEVFSPPGTTKPPMGVGNLPIGTTKYDSFFIHVAVLNEFGQTVDADNLEEFADNNKLYNVLDEGIQKDDGHVVLYGGHGGSTDV